MFPGGFPTNPCRRIWTTAPQGVARKINQFAETICVLFREELDPGEAEKSPQARAETALEPTAGEMFRAPRSSRNSLECGLENHLSDSFYYCSFWEISFQECGANSPEF